MAKYTLWYISSNKQASLSGGEYDSVSEAWEAQPRVEREFRDQCTEEAPYDEGATWSVEPT